MLGVASALTAIKIEHDANNVRRDRRSASDELIEMSRERERERVPESTSTTFHREDGSEAIKKKLCGIRFEWDFRRPIPCAACVFQVSLLLGRNGICVPITYAVPELDSFCAINLE